MIPTHEGILKRCRSVGMSSVLRDARPRRRGMTRSRPAVHCSATGLDAGALRLNRRSHSESVGSADPATDPAEDEGPRRLGGRSSDGGEAEPLVGITTPPAPSPTDGPGDDDAGGGAGVDEVEDEVGAVGEVVEAADECGIGLVGEEGEGDEDDDEGAIDKAGTGALGEARGREGGVVPASSSS